MENGNVYDSIEKGISGINCDVAQFAGIDCSDNDFCAECMAKSAKAIVARLRETTFERPLFEDGEPVQVGDETEHGVVVSIELNLDSEGVKTRITYGDGDFIALGDGERVRRRQVDTQDRIDADAVKYVNDYWKCESLKCTDCPSKIDGKTPMEHYGVDICRKAMTLDLLRRQQWLDARTMGVAE